MLKYEGGIWRPPSEARSLILQATVGCSHNACIFCVSYKQKQYRVRGADGVKSDLDSLPDSYKQRVRRVFLADVTDDGIPETLDGRKEAIRYVIGKAEKFGYTKSEILSIRRVIWAL